MSKKEILSEYTIGEHIRIERKSLGLRQTDLAKQAGLPGSHLSDIERGVAIPTIPTLYKIGQALNRPLEYFFQKTSDHPRSLGMVFHETSIGGQAVQKFVELVNEKSDGGLNLDTYHQAALGSARDQLTSLIQGGIHLFIDEPISFEPYAPLCGPVFLPYFFKDRDHYYRFIDSAIFMDEVYHPLLQKGIRLLNPHSRWEGGDYELLFSNHPVFSPKDLQGKRMRTYDSSAAIELRKQLGAVPVVVEWENVVQAFQRDEIDILLCPSSYFNVLRLHEVAGYATLLRYGYTVNLNVAMNEKEYSRLRPSIQKTLADAAAQTGECCAKLAGRQTRADLENLSARYGVPVIQPDEKLWQQAFRAAIEKVCCKGFIDGDLYETIQHL